MNNSKVSPAPRFRSIDEVAAQLGVAPKSVRRWVARRELAAHRLGRLVRIRDTDLERFLERNRL